MRKRFFLALFVFALFVTPLARAQGEGVATDPPDLSSPSAVTKEPPYQLPYPGILPDSPLYPLKTFRDRIILFLIADPVKKAEFNLLQADKRLSASVQLIKKRKGKESLAESTASKAEAYFAQAVVSVKDAKKQGMEVSGFAGRLLLAAAHHRKVLNEFAASVGGSLGARFADLEKQVADLEKEVITFTKN